MICRRVSLPLVVAFAIGLCGCGPNTWNDNLYLRVRNDTSRPVVSRQCWDAQCHNLVAQTKTRLSSGQSTEYLVGTAVQSGILFMTMGGRVLGCVKVYVPGTYTGPEQVVRASEAKPCTRGV